jgi:hypothetical protein
MLNVSIHAIECELGPCRHGRMICQVLYYLMKNFFAHEGRGRRVSSAAPSSPGRNHANIHDLDSVSRAGRPARSRSEEGASAGRTQRRRVRAVSARLDVTLSIYAHTDLDAMREALDSIEWDDL